MSVKFNVVKSLEEQSSEVNCVVYFEGRNLLTTCFDHVITVIDIDTGKCKKLFENHEGKVNELIKFDEDVFLSCGADNTIFSYSLDTMKILKKFELNESPVFSLMKNRDENNCFMTINEKNEIKVIDFGRNKVRRELTSFKVNSSTRLVHSVNNKYCFYFNASKEDRNKIRSYNYKDNKLVKLFRKHRCEINSLSVFLNSLKEEMFVAAGNDGFLYIYNTTFPKFSNNLIKRLQLLNKPSSILCYGQGHVPGCRLYGIIGTVKGTIELYDFCSTKDSKFRKITEFEMHQKNKSVTCMCFVKFLNPKKRLTLVSGSQDKSAKIFTIDGIVNVDEGGGSKEKKKKGNLEMDDGEPKSPLKSPVSQFKKREAVGGKERRKSVISMMDESDEEEEEHEGEEEEETTTTKIEKKKEISMMDDDDDEIPPEEEEEEQPEIDTKKIDMMGDLEEKEEVGETKKEKEMKLMVELEEHLLEKEMMLDVLKKRVVDKDAIIDGLVKKLTKVRDDLVENNKIL